MIADPVDEPSANSSSHEYELVELTAAAESPEPCRNPCSGHCAFPERCPDHCSLITGHCSDHCSLITGHCSDHCSLITDHCPAVVDLITPPTNMIPNDKKKAPRGVPPRSKTKVLKSGIANGRSRVRRRLVARSVRTLRSPSR
jgi:hypothetical protein